MNEVMSIGEVVVRLFDQSLAMGIIAVAWYMSDKRYKELFQEMRDAARERENKYWTLINRLTGVDDDEKMP